MAMNKLRKIMFATAAKEASYDAGCTVDSLIAADGDNFVQEEVALYNNKNSLTGVEEGTSQEKVAQHVTLSLSQEAVKPHTLFYVAAMVLGSVASSATGATSKKHMIRPLPLSTTTLPSTQAEGILEDGSQSKLTGVFFDSFEWGFTDSPERLIKLSAQAFGSGTIAAGTATSTEKSENILTASSVGLWIGETTYAGATSDTIDLSTSELNGSPAKASSKVLSFSYKCSNSSDINLLWTPESGLYFGRTLRGERVQTISMTFLMDDETHVTRLLSQNNAAMQIKVKGAQIEANRFYGLSQIHPLIKYTAARRGQQNGKTTVAVEALVMNYSTWPSVLFDGWNTQSTYIA